MKRRCRLPPVFLLVRLALALLISYCLSFSQVRSSQLPSRAIIFESAVFLEETFSQRRDVAARSGTLVVV